MNVLKMFKNFKSRGEEDQLRHRENEEKREEMILKTESYETKKDEIVLKTESKNPLSAYASFCKKERQNSLKKITSTELWKKWTNLKEKEKNISKKRLNKSPDSEEDL